MRVRGRSVAGGRGVAAVLIAAAACLGLAAPAIAADPITTTTNKEIVLDRGETKTGDITVTTTKAKPKADVMFVIDRTGSMTSPIKWVASGLGQVVNQLHKDGANDIHIGVVTFTDLGSVGNLPGAYKLDMPLGANSTSAVQAKLNEIAGSVTGGGDLPEDSVYGMMRAIDETPWRADASHTVVLVTDASTKFRETQSVGGQPATSAGLKALVSAKSINLSLQDITGVSQTPTATLSDISSLATATGGSYFLSKNESTLVNNISVGMQDDSTEWGVTRTVTCVYESDGAPSTEVDVKVTPESMKLPGDDTGKFVTTATASATTERGGDSTICTVQAYVDGVSAGEDGRHVIRYAPSAVGGLAVVKASDPDRDENVKIGQEIVYTVTISNETGLRLTDAEFSDAIKDVLDDADLDESSVAINGPGSAAFNADTETIDWTGDLAVDGKAVLTYTATVKAGGNLQMPGTVSTKSTLATSCGPDTMGEICTVTHQVIVPATQDAKEPAPAQESLATTGFGGTQIAILAVILLLAGVATVVVVRRRSAR